MSMGKMFVSPHGNYGVSIHLSDAWYEIVEETRCYQHLSLTHTVIDGVLVISVVLLFLKVSVFFRKNDGGKIWRV